jgi:hypothetical protein
LAPAHFCWSGAFPESTAQVDLASRSFEHGTCHEVGVRTDGKVNMIWHRIEVNGHE